ncbi:hypothetical protein ATEIFO6365_0001092100 [Aspergillus terreus]|uniref:CorA-like transporter domain-containing protein n=1 Tax=Aspergillus terreus TaxID=33178 RepID=A0A5M3YRD0_ASPTE|nr:hypothetical protein ATETN484_0001084200 [Aspergillus terreus]GFF12697.1 hypothetical protein ATEIFO6365_0001092100 [Aspergillus terreus]
MEPADIATCPAWNAYFQDLAEDPPTTVDCIALQERVQQAKLFTTGEDLHVRITDISQNGHGVRSTKLTCKSDISSGLDLGFHLDSSIKIISICSKNSLDPLLIPPDLMGRIMQTHKIDPSFLHILLSFNEPIYTSTTGARNAIVSSPDGSDSYTSYQMFYVEAKNRGRPKPTVSFRRTGVYHHRRAGRDLFILLHPNEQSKFDVRLQDFIGAQQARTATRLSSFIENPSVLHSILFSTFTDNWRWFISNLGEEFEHINDYALTKVRPGISMDPDRSLEEISRLRNLADLVHLVRICSKGNLDIIQRLQARSPQPAAAHDIFEATITGCIASCEGLIPRIQNATDMIQTAQTQKWAAEMQTQAAATGRELRDLTVKLKDLQKHTVDDSAAVKIITVMSAVYLPGSFVVSLYGMNFFDFNEANKQIVISNEFWIFVATWLPLTFLTMAVYILIVYFDKWWKREPFRIFTRPRSKNMK